MPLSAEQERRRAHEFVDRIPDEQVSMVSSLLEALLNRDLEKEPVTEEDRQRILDGREKLSAGGRGAPMEDVLADFGLIADDLPQHRSRAYR